MNVKTVVQRVNFRSPFTMKLVESESEDKGKKREKVQVLVRNVKMTIEGMLTVYVQKE